MRRWILTCLVIVALAASGHGPVALHSVAGLATAHADAGREGGVRVKDVTSLKGMRDNQLVGYGLVIGLPGSGDTMRNSPFTEQSLRSMLDRMGVNVRCHPACTQRRRRDLSPPICNPSPDAARVST